MLKAAGPQVKEMGFDSAVIRGTVIQGMATGEALNTPALEESPLGQHVDPEKKAQSSPSSTPAGRGEFCFLWFDTAAKHCLGEQ